MRRLALIPAFVLLACGPAPTPTTPAGGNVVLAKHLRETFEIAARKPAAAGFDAWTKLLAEATADGARSEVSRDVALAALDALTGNAVFGLEALGPISPTIALADGRARLERELDRVLALASLDPTVAAYAANARLHLGAMDGAPAAVAAAKARSGCVSEATLVGPFVGAALAQLEAKGPLDDGDLAAFGTDAARSAPRASYVANEKLAIRPTVASSSGHGCELAIVGGAQASGLRYVVVDVTAPADGRVFVGVDSALPFTLLADGKTVASARYGELGGSALRFGGLRASGTVRLVLKLAAYAGEPIDLFVLDGTGHPLPTHAAAGAAPAPSVTAVDAAPSRSSTLTKDPEAVLAEALGLIARGESRLAEAALEPLARTPGGKADPAIALAWARTLTTALDLPAFRRNERLRQAHETVLAGWPDAWESQIGIAKITATQRQGGAGDVEAIAELGNRKKQAGGEGDVLLDAWLAIAGDDVLGIGDAALARATPKLAGTELGFRLTRATQKKTDDALATWACAPNRPDLGDLGCASARLRLGDHDGTLAEITRLRTLFAAPKLASDLAIRATLRSRGAPAARAVYDAADVGDRSSLLAREIAGSGVDGARWLRGVLRETNGDPRSLTEWMMARRAAGDAAGGADVASELDGRTRAIIAEDRKHRQMPAAGTVILDREERYALDRDGFMHVMLWDVRRLGGTTDVEANAVARGGGSSTAEAGVRRVVHRIFKADGTVVEPDKIDAAQAGAELSQIEPDDYVELVSEGWFLARADGAIDFDTPDLLPARTAVVHASIELDAPSDVPLRLWSHPELGPPSVTEAGGARRSVWKLQNHDVRRGERSQSAMDAQVAVRMGSWSWSRIARDAEEGLLQTDESLPEVSRWVDAAVGTNRAPTVDLLARLLREAKRTLPRVGFLPLGPGNEFGPQSYDARTVLLDAQGSRVALLHRALGQLGIQHGVAFSELSPYSADANMPPRPWRFSHALLFADVADTAGGPLHRVWLDPDVEGTPPPPGRTSPELRGRSALTAQGEIVPIPANPDGDPDLATIDWTVDEHGDGKGTLALLLRGRDAQEAAAILEETAGDERDDALRELVASWVPDADVTEPKASTETWQVVVTAKVARKGFLVPDGGKLAIGGVPALHGGAQGTLGSTYAAQAKRTTALTIRNATLYELHRRVRLPAGSAVATPLPALDVSDDGATMKAKRSVRVDGNTVIDDVSFSLPTGVVEVAKFGAFTAHAKAIDDGFGASVRVSLAGKTSTEKVK
jgi:hypothetical protein